MPIELRSARGEEARGEDGAVVLPRRLLRQEARGVSADLVGALEGQRDDPQQPGSSAQTTISDAGQGPPALRASAASALTPHAATGRAGTPR